MSRAMSLSDLDLDLAQSGTDDANAHSFFFLIIFPYNIFSVD